MSQRERRSRSRDTFLSIPGAAVPAAINRVGATIFVICSLGLLVYAALPGATAGPPPKDGGGGRKHAATTTTTTTTAAVRHATVLAVAPPVTVPTGVCLNYDGCSSADVASLTARLTTAEGAPLADKVVTILSGSGGQCSGTTNAAGVTTCLVTTYGVATSAYAYFYGDAVYAPSNGRFRLDLTG